ncbi:DUF3427 domain-containing protein [Dyadobacter sp. CY347]|uniref:DUF3427 domain-containing protein n=1 Tax=Dyadobacter sp. CY347 TaxID=2909336 RepID=UPI001F1DEE6D|nr:DUF3427 domain-containing protein [Dyadobacter sp. CY347]MCF2489920.1 DUF3427 domain-containing protein [Dyadobacter sp. CY347]
MRDAMLILLEFLQEEPEASVRAVLRHFIFVFIHPYMDGNGPMGQFLMNAMLASGGYPWTVIPVESRDEYIYSLEKACVEQNIEPFAAFLGRLVNEEIRVELLRYYLVPDWQVVQPLPFVQPLKVHSRYTREQILAAFGENTFERKSSNREGVVNLEAKNAKLQLITLEKTEANYSPTTLYNDYAVSEKIFHWQSQNTARPETGKGLSYVKQSKRENQFIFVREKNNDEFNNTIAYVFLGLADYINHYGAKPMSINWALRESALHYIWKDMAKMPVG